MPAPKITTVRSWRRIYNSRNSECDSTVAEIKNQGQKMEQEKQYTGYGYHGGGRKKKDESEKKIYKNITISGTPEELENLKQKAKTAGKTVSRYVIESL